MDRNDSRYETEFPDLKRTHGHRKSNQYRETKMQKTQDWLEKVKNAKGNCQPVPKPPKELMQQQQQRIKKLIDECKRLEKFLKLMFPEDNKEKRKKTDKTKETKETKKTDKTDEKSRDTRTLGNATNTCMCL